MKEVLEAIENEIQRLQRAKEILLGTSMIATNGSVRPTRYNGKKYTKRKRWSDIQAKQLIELYNAGYPSSKMAKTLAMPKHRIWNKVWALKKAGILKERGF